MVVTVPLKAYLDIPAEPLAGKVVIDTNNYYPRRDGGFPELEEESTTVSDVQAKTLLVKLYDQFGFDAVDAGALAEGWRVQRDTPAYGVRQNAEELRKSLAAAKRYRDM